MTSNVAPHAHTPLSLSAKDSEGAGRGLSNGGAYGMKQQDETKSNNNWRSPEGRSIIGTLLYLVLFVEIMLVFVAVINGLVSGEFTSLVATSTAHHANDATRTKQARVLDNTHNTKTHW